MQPRKTVSLAEAALLTGKDKSTISKRLIHKDESKRIVGHKDNNDAWIINIASLSTHYKIPTENLNKLEDKLATDSIVNSPLNSPPRNSEFNSNSTHEIIELRAEVKFLHKQVEQNEEQAKDTKKTIEDLRNDRDHWKDSAKQAQETVTRQTYLLEHHQQDKQESILKPVESEKEDLATEPPESKLKPLYDVIWAFIIAMIAVALVLSTKDYWLPIAQSFLNR